MDLQAPERRIGFVIMQIIDFKQDLNIVDACIETLRKPGSVLLLPTETVYGLMCVWQDVDAEKRIRDLKGRDLDKPFQILTADLRSAQVAGVRITPEIAKVAEKFCPGPITIIAGTENAETSVGFRIPDHQLILEIMKSASLTLAATSANISGRPPATSVQSALAELNGIPDLVVDAGKISGKASTVVDMSGKRVKVLRSGPISESEILECLGLSD